jgi:dynein heavy chain, axonemal
MSTELLSVVAEHLRAITEALGTSFEDSQWYEARSGLTAHCLFPHLEAKMGSFMFNGQEVILESSCAYFATLNPMYIGRFQLPENLKSYFRTSKLRSSDCMLHILFDELIFFASKVTMANPDTTLIVETILISQNFTNARILARKLVTLFKLADEQLSLQKHYDFGLRTVKVR